MQGVSFCEGIGRFWGGWMVGKPGAEHYNPIIEQTPGEPMDKAEFVDVIRLVVQEGSVDDTRSVLLHPPGRKPVPKLIALSEWFKQLPPEDQQNVLRVAGLASRHAVFGFLCVLDGVRAIENGPNKGTLELRYRGSGLDVHLNDDKGSGLHDLL